MKKKSGKLLFVIILALFCASFCDQMVSAEQIKLTYAGIGPASAFPCVQMEKWSDEVEKRTGGKLLIQTFPGGTLLKTKAVIDGVTLGQADIGALCMAYQPGRFFVTNALGLPLGISSAKIGSLTLWDIYEKYKPESFAKVKVLSMFTSAPANIMSKKAIRKIEDFRGLPIRASGVAAQVLKLWHANPVGMPMPETPAALQKGVVQGLFSSLEVLKDFKFAELCKYATFTNTVVYPFAVVMNMEKWNSLPKNIQKILDDMRVEHSKWVGDYVDKHAEEAIVWSKEKQRVEFIKLSSQDEAKCNELVEPIIKKWRDEAKSKGLPGDEIISDIKKFAKTYGNK